MINTLDIKQTLTSKCLWPVVYQKYPDISEAVINPGKHITCPFHGGESDFRFYPDAFTSNPKSSTAAVCTCGKFSHYEMVCKLEGRSVNDAEVARILAEVVGMYETTPAVEPPKTKPKGSSYPKTAWEQSIEVAGAGLTYLEKRGLPPVLPDSIRYLPDSKYLGKNSPSYRGPCLVGRCSYSDNSLAGIIRIFLSPEGGKASIKNAKPMLGFANGRSTPLSGSAVRMPGEGSIEHVGEGIETMLAIRSLFPETVNACGTATLLKHFKPAKGTTGVIVWADLDKSETGEKAAATLAKKLMAQKIPVSIALPKTEIPKEKKGVDWLDIFNQPNGAEALKSVYTTSRESLSQMTERFSSQRQTNKIKPYVPTVIENSLDLINTYMGNNRQKPHWHTIQNEDGTQIDYAEHEDDIILWAQTNDLPSAFYTERGLGTAYRKIQRAAYCQLIKDVAESITQPARLSDDKPEETIKLDFFDQIGLSEAEALCLAWWMKDRKRVLLELAEGKIPEICQVPMPIFYSRMQRTGKSFLIKRLCEPFQELHEVKSIDEIEDQFNYQQWSQLLIANFDEMAGLSRTDINRLKQWSYQQVFTKRRMRSQQQDRIVKRSAGIGSTNNSIAEIIWDTTGTRRFCQIDAKTDGSLIHAATSIDFLNIWRAVDHTKPLSEKEYGVLYRQLEEQRRKDVVELWYADIGKEFLIALPKNSASGSEIYINFRRWCDQNGEKEYSNTKFGRRLKELKFPGLSWTHSNGIKYTLTLS